MDDILQWGILSVLSSSAFFRAHKTLKLPGVEVKDRCYLAIGQQLSLGLLKSTGVLRRFCAPVTLWKGDTENE